MSDYIKEIDEGVEILREALRLPALENCLSHLKDDLFQVYTTITHEFMKETNLNDSLKFLAIMDELSEKFSYLIKGTVRINAIMHYEAIRLEKENKKVD